MPPCCIRPRVVKKFTTLLRDAGPLHEADPCSQIEHATMFADTDTPEPELVPRGTRSVSYGLHGLAAPCRIRVVAVRQPRARLAAGPSAKPKPVSWRRPSPKMIAPLARRSAMSGESFGGTSIA